MDKHSFGTGSWIERSLRSDFEIKEEDITLLININLQRSTSTSDTGNGNNQKHKAGVSLESSF